MKPDSTLIQVFLYEVPETSSIYKRIRVPESTLYINITACILEIVYEVYVLSNIKYQISYCCILRKISIKFFNKNDTDFNICFYVLKKLRHTIWKLIKKICTLMDFPFLAKSLFS